MSKPIPTKPVMRS